MPAADVLRNDEKERDKDKDLDRNDRGGSKSKSSASSASKSKDLSHVPCKFYKVGGCTAGSSCPFSHNLPEPGHKEICTWFVKGNCKFGHKCALAHVLPGQSMAMDRKNKKAAQLAANSGGGGSEKPGPKDAKGARSNGGKKEGSTAPGHRNSLLTGGSTAPTRILNASSSTRPPMSLLKTSTSPSAPAPPLASLGGLEDLENEGIQLPTAPAQGKPGSGDNATSSTTASPEEASTAIDADPTSQTKSSSPGPLPMSVPRSALTPTQPKPDFGPIGSPPTSGSLSSQIHSNAVRDDITPGTSPKNINGIHAVPDSPGQSQSFVPSSPFSAPGTQTNFLNPNSFNGVGGIASSLSALTIMGGRKGGWGNSSGENGNGISSQRQQLNGQQHDVLRRGVGMNIPRDLENAVEDADMEDFLPSSLTDLLTPEERQRRMSRSHSGQTPNTAAPIGHLIRDHTTVNSSGSGMGHRYSRSVPAPSLLGDIKSIWSDNPNGQGLPASPGHRATPSSSFTQRYDPLSNSTADEMGLSISVGSTGSGMMGLSPSNASAAFLSGFHSGYLNNKAKQAQAAQLGLGNLGRGVRGTSGPLYGGSGNTGTSLSNNNGFGGGVSNLSSAGAIHTHTNPHTNVQHSYRAAPSPFDLTQQQHLYPQTARPIPSNFTNAASGNGGGEDVHQTNHLLSPSARALQSHAPGQSLPQGLAAGYSRIHALPPPPNLASPSSAGLFGTPPTGSDLAIPSSGPYGQWKGAASPPNNGGGFDGMFSRLSYSAATARNGQASGSSTPVPAGQGISASGPPPGLTRTVSGSKQSTGPLSPLSRPAAPARVDDDELFDMDG